MELYIIRRQECIRIAEHVNFFSTEKACADYNITNSHWLQLLYSPERCSCSVFTVMEHCVGWELAEAGSRKSVHMKMLLRCHIAANVSDPDEQQRIMQQIKRAGPAAHYIRFHFELRPFIHFWHLQLDQHTPSARPLGFESALRPHQPLWKNPEHLTRIA